MKLRTIGAVTAIGAATLGMTLVACEGDSSQGGNVTLEVATVLSVTSPALKVLQGITSVCAPAGTTVNLVPGSSTYEADMKARLASGDLPDIWATHGWSLLRYSSFLEPLNDQPWASNFNPALAPAMQNAQGQFFALPITTDVAGIVYSQDALDSAGIEVADLTTWDTFTEALGKLKAAGITPIGSSAKEGWLAGNIADFLASGAYQRSELDQFKAGTFSSSGYANILNQAQSWAKAGYFNADFSSATSDDIAASIGQGKTAFTFAQNSIVSSTLERVPNAKLGYFPFPSFTGSPYLVGGEGVTSYGVNKHGAHKQQSLDYLACLAKPENLGKLASSASGIPGLTNASADLGVLQQSYDSWVKDNAYPLQPYFDRVYLPNGMWSSMVSTTVGVIAGQSDVSAAIGQMSQQFKTLYGQK